MKQYMPYIKVPHHGTLHDFRPLDSMEAALAKYEEWARDFHITSAWIEERDPERPWSLRRHKVKLVGVLKKEVSE